jgi:hypothetical protein
MVATNDKTNGLTFFGTTLGGGTYNYGVMIKVGNCRSPHIVQFISRQILEADGKTYKSGTYTNSSGRSYPLSTTANPYWDTDSSAKPNAYYDEQHGTPNTIGPLNLTIFDAPNFTGPIYDPNAHESWFARFEDYVFCNARWSARCSGQSAGFGWSIMQGPWSMTLLYRSVRRRRAHSHTSINKS